MPNSQGNTLVLSPKPAFVLVLSITATYITVMITQESVSKMASFVTSYDSGSKERKYHSFSTDPSFIPHTGFDCSLMLLDRNSSTVVAFNTDRPIVIQWRTTINRKNPHIKKLFERCPVHNCLLLPMILPPNATSPYVDAYLFHLWGGETVKMPEQRTMGQKYIFVNQESEIRTPIPTYLKSVFNLTMTHRSDSDIPIPYGAIHRKLPNDPRPKPGTNFAANKTGFAAWAVGHCHPPSKREIYVAELQKFISVDVYGKCGSKICPEPGCWDHINKKYKFYLAFENSLCVDYVTEKLYRTLNHGKMIPIVLGGANYTALLPEKSFINVADFESPRTLSKYLKILDINDTLYNEYFQWQHHYKASVRIGVTKCTCGMCAYLHFNKSSKKIYPDMRQWYSESRCMEPKEYYGPLIDIPWINETTERDTSTVIFKTIVVDFSWWRSSIFYMEMCNALLHPLLKKATAFRTVHPCAKVMAIFLNVKIFKLWLFQISGVSKRSFD